MRYTLTQSETPNHWVCTDTQYLIVCVFENKKFNESQKMTRLEDFNPNNFMLLARIMREMGDWIGKNHREKV